jgi:hypothetical protein
MHPGLLTRCFFDGSVLLTLVFVPAQYNGHAVLHGHPGAGAHKGFTGLRFEGNTYALQNYGGKQSIVLAETPDALEKGSCQGVVIKDEINGDSDWRVKQTTFTLSKTVVGSTTTFEFADYLLFPWIDQVQYSVEYSRNDAVPSATASTDHGEDGTTVTVRTANMNGSVVHVTATQCPYTPGAPNRK